MRIVLDLPIDADGPRSVAELLNVLIRIWGRHLRRFPLPPLYSQAAGIRFAPDAKSGVEERWRAPAKTFEAGSGDCDQLVLYRGAELVARGEHATAQCIARRTPAGTKMHVRVRRQNGTIEDPSIILMGASPWDKTNVR
jgi:hypothetical protein